MSLHPGVSIHPGARWRAPNRCIISTDDSDQHTQVLFQRRSCNREALVHHPLARAHIKSALAAHSSPRWPRYPPARGQDEIRSKDARGGALGAVHQGHAAADLNGAAARRPQNSYINSSGGAPRGGAPRARWRGVGRRGLPDAPGRLSKTERGLRPSRAGIQGGPASCRLGWRRRAWPGPPRTPAPSRACWRCSRLGLRSGPPPTQAPPPRRPPPLTVFGPRAWLSSAGGCASLVHDAQAVSWATGTATRYCPTKTIWRIRPETSTDCGNI